MARSFTSASSHYLEHSGVPVAGNPFVMCGWFYVPDVTNVYTLMALDNNSGEEYAALNLQGNFAGDPVRMQSRSSGVTVAAVTSTGYTANTWHHALGVSVHQFDRRVFLDGGSKGSNTDQSFPSFSLTGIGRLYFSGTRTNFMQGRIADAAIWNLTNWPGATNVDKADAFEAVAVGPLARGVSPLRFPLGLVAYWPLWGDASPEPDLHPRSTVATDYPMTVTGAVKGNHAPVRLFSPAPPLIHILTVNPLADRGLHSLQSGFLVS